MSTNGPRAAAIPPGERTAVAASRHRNDPTAGRLGRCLRAIGCCRCRPRPPRRRCRALVERTAFRTQVPRVATSLRQGMTTVSSSGVGPVTRTYSAAPWSERGPRGRSASSARTPGFRLEAVREIARRRTGEVRRAESLRKDACLVESATPLHRDGILTRRPPKPDDEPRRRAPGGPGGAGKARAAIVRLDPDADPTAVVLAEHGRGRTR